MKAIALTPGTTNLNLVDRPAPKLLTPTDVKLRVLQVGICGTDREEAAGGRAQAPNGSSELIIGHEMLGQVVEVGPAVRDVKVGDCGVLSVRRSCGHCPACAADRSDLCFTDDYTERGIKGADGYQAEYVVDDASHFVPVPPETVPFGVLAEPMSIVAKGIDQGARSRTAHLSAVFGSDDPFAGRAILVAGLGAVGLLAAFALALRGASIHGLDVFDHDNLRVSLLERAGGVYVDGRDPTNEAQQRDHFDFIFEATGVAHVEFDLLTSLAPNGVYVAMGIPGGDRLIDLDGAAIFRNLVLNNQTLVGSVNASIEHIRTAVADLTAANRRWPGMVEALITSRRPVEDYKEALTIRQPDEIKTVLEWSAI